MEGIGYVPFHDRETGKVTWLDTSDKGAMKKFGKVSRNNDARLHKMFKSLGIDYMELFCGQPYINDLIAFFKKRERRMQR